MTSRAITRLNFDARRSQLDLWIPPVTGIYGKGSSRGEIGSLSIESSQRFISDLTLTVLDCTDNLDFRKKFIFH